jgi:hypothetical protein
VLMASLSTQLIQAQTLRLADVSLYGGGGSALCNPLSNQEVDQFRNRLTIPSKIGMRYTTSNMRNSNQIGILAGWNVKQKNPTNLVHQFRAGISFGTYQLNFDGSKNVTTRTHVDTLTSSMTGDKYYIDSILNQYSSVRHNANMLNLEASYIVRLLPERKFSFYTGLGIRLGFSTQNYIEANYHENSTRENNYTSSTNYSSMSSSTNFVSEQEIVNVGNTTTFRFYAPIGVNYRISNKSALLKHVNVFVDYNIGFEMSKFSNVKNNIGFYNGMNAGIRISLLDGNSKAKNRAERQQRTIIRKHRRY